jgi:hypothetical protein
MATFPAKSLCVSAAWRPLNDATQDRTYQDDSAFAENAD